MPRVQAHIAQDHRMATNADTKTTRLLVSDAAAFGPSWDVNYDGIVAMVSDI